MGGTRPSKPLSSDYSSPLNARHTRSGVKGISRNAQAGGVEDSAGDGGGHAVHRDFGYRLCAEWALSVS